VVGRERYAAVIGGISLGVRRLRESQIERRSLCDLATGGINNLLSPSRAPALFHALGQVRRLIHRNATPQQVSEHAMDESARTAVDKRKRSRDQGMIRRRQADLLRERKSEHHPSFAVVGQALACRAVDQRVEVW
jgi:hypothetical protein